MVVYSYIRCFILKKATKINTLMTKSENAFNEKKNSGIVKMNEQKYDDAITDFSYVINKLESSTDEDILLLMICLLNRSFCSLVLKQIDSAKRDANQVISLYKEKRSEIDFIRFDQAKVKDDVLTNPLSLAYVRLGQINEVEGQFMMSLRNYRTSDILTPKGSGEEAIFRLFKKLSVPDILTEDGNMNIYKKIRDDIEDSDKVSQHLYLLMESMVNNGVDSEYFGSIKISLCVRLLYSIIQLHMKEEVIVVLVLSILRIFSENNIMEVYSGIKVIKTTLEEWNSSSAVAGDSLKLLSGATPQVIKLMHENNFVTTIAGSLLNDLSDEEYDIGYMLLHKILIDEKSINDLSETEILDTINEHFLPNSILLLAKLSQIPKIVKKIETTNIIDSLMRILNDGVSDNIISSAAIVISQFFVYIHDKKDNSKVQDLSYMDERIKSLQKIANKVSNHIYPLVHKSPSFTSNILAVFASSVAFNTDFIKNNKVISTISTILQSNINNVDIVMNSVSFFYSCTQNSLLDDVKNTKDAATGVLKALENYNENAQIIERSIATLIELGHSSARDFLRTAIRKYPQSQILGKYV